MPAILIIDDDEQMCVLLQQILEIEGFEVMIAKSGRDAMELYQNHDISLIVTDILMPDMDGMEIILKLRMEKEPPPIIAISGGGKFSRAGECISWAENLGVQDTFTKPIDRKGFVNRVRELITD